MFQPSHTRLERHDEDRVFFFGWTFPLNEMQPVILLTQYMKEQPLNILLLDV